MGEYTVAVVFFWQYVSYLLLPEQGKLRFVGCEVCFDAFWHKFVFDFGQCAVTVYRDALFGFVRDGALFH